MEQFLSVTKGWSATSTLCTNCGGCSVPRHIYMGKAHKNCIIGKILCLRHIIGTTFITRMTLYVYIVEGFKTSQNIYTFI